MKKRILIIADSVAMPRPEVPYEMTWIYGMKDKFPEYEFIDRTSRGTTSFRLISEGGGGSDLLENYRPDLVILQFGITECAPRLFKKKGFENFIMNKIMGNKIRQRYINFIKRHRIRNPKLTDISPENFKNHVEQYIKRCLNTGTKVLILEILKPTHLFIKKSPFIGKNIELYNEIYRSFSRKHPHVMTIYPVDSSLDKNEYFVDELHVNIKGSHNISQNVSREIRKILKQ